MCFRKNFLAPDADASLGVKDQVLVEIKKAIDEGKVTLNMFDPVQKEAYSTMQFCLYPEYLCFLNASREVGCVFA